MSNGDFPYSTSPDNKPINFKMDTSDQMSKYKGDEKFQKAPPIVPFDVEAMNSTLGNIFVSFLVSVLLRPLTNVDMIAIPAPTFLQIQ